MWEEHKGRHQRAHAEVLSDAHNDNLHDSLQFWKVALTLNLCVTSKDPNVMVFAQQKLNPWPFLKLWSVLSL